MKGNIKGILIDPRNKTITEVTVDNDNFLQSMYKLMSCNILEVVRDVVSSKKPKHTLWVDEEGNYKKNPSIFFINGYLIKGPSIILGDRGEYSCSSKLTVDDVKQIIEWKFE